MNKASDPVLFQPETLLPDSRAFSAEVDIAMAHFLEVLQQTEAQIQQLEQSLQGKDDTIQQQSRVIEELKQRVATLESYLRLARSQTYGRSSEKSEGQWDIFNELDAPAPDDEAPETNTHEPKPRANKKGRKPLAAHLPRHQVFAKLTEAEKKGALTTMGNTLIRLSKQLQPLINLLMDHLRSGPLINADETRMQVLKEMSKSINSDALVMRKYLEPAGRSTGSTSGRLSLRSFAQ